MVIPGATDLSEIFVQRMKLSQIAHNPRFIHCHQSKY